MYNAAGKASSSLSREIDIKRPLVLRDFITDVVHDPMDYTTYDSDGAEIIDKKVKKIYDKADQTHPRTVLITTTPTRRM